MAANDKIKADLRDSRGTSTAKKIRASGMVPGVVYGHKMDTLNIVIDEKELIQKTRGIAGGHLYDLEIIDDSKKKRTVLVKEFQKDPIRGILLHVDFQQIAMDEHIETHVPVRLVGEAVGVKEGGVLDHHLRDVSIRVLPADMPDIIEVDITDLQVGNGIRVSALNVSGGVEILNDQDDIVVSVLPPTKIKEEVPEEVIEEEEAAPAKAEGAIKAEEKETGEG